MSMSGDSIDKLYYSQNNLDNTFKQVSEEISRRTNKDISNNMSYKKSFQAMAKMVYDKFNEVLSKTDAGRCKCIKVECFENDNNSSIYEE